MTQWTLRDEKGVAQGNSTYHSDLLQLDRTADFHSGRRTFAGLAADVSAALAAVAHRDSSSQKLQSVGLKVVHRIGAFKNKAKASMLRRCWMMATHAFQKR
jgi:hypothetical protein